MMLVRQLEFDEVREAMKLKILCWSEELAGLAENTLQLEQEETTWSNWLRTADVNNDIRLFIGAFDEKKLTGVAAASFIDSKYEPENGIELNGLWVHPSYRGRGISVALLNKVLEYFMPLGVIKLEVYSHHYAPSNMYYQKFGGQVINQIYQLNDQLLIDIFNFDANSLYQHLAKYRI